ncbi:hypothetical protein HAX54_048168 [Datura stramonium]|uniref:RING-type E3 ubiquitin transferase n=1 Tax=Datura stramonium TaxID=4076 RepID=A0ABS8SUW6_DATST|nr:hypothetical protein [Datura stramonium]
MMSFFFRLDLLLIVVTSFAVFGEGGNDCRESRCDIDNGPSIHFPFRLQHQPEHCGYPGFELSCNNSKTILTLPNSPILVVEDIDYASQQIRLYSPFSCVVKLLHFNFSASPFHLNDELPLCNYSIFNCSGVTNDDVGSLGCSAAPYSKLIAVINRETLDDDVEGCTKIDEIPSRPCVLEYGGSFSIGWLNPNCSYCEGLEMDCGFKNYTKQLTTQCFNRPVITTKGGLKEPLIAGGVLARNTTHVGTGVIAPPSSAQEFTVISELE